MYGNDVIVEEDIYDDPDLTDEPMEPNTRVVDEPL
jgi:hypothetical protein